MSTPATATATATSDGAINKDHNGTGQMDHAADGRNVTTERRQNYGGNPLAHINTGESARFPAFGGEFQPGLYRPTTERKFANPAPLGLSAFALTTFVLSLINVGARGLAAPNIVVSLAFGYGGFVQLLAGMWEMAVGNTFGATALSSYGGFWISVAIILTPGGFEIVDTYTSDTSGPNDFNNAFGIFLIGWWVFTTILLACTLRSTVAFFLLFFFLDLAFLFLAIGHLLSKDGAVNTPCIKTGGYFGIFAALVAWYNAFAGIADDGNSFFVVPVAHFPWSVKGRERRAKTAHEVV
ncbi:GPR1/FUN34/yaaH family-domain-containing protein [Calycina marina]|uniref:GPR1/FUN34/yaaH family-domain-containing protein n=1 Tax=Calycina marina TaxID=1763456 RepID=A0A9P7Z1Q2_9HELO|nr:GPR1/FUN34/yaaH family-domain-containing protein [Calycina marina]